MDGLNVSVGLINDWILWTKALDSGGMTVTWKTLTDSLRSLSRHIWPQGLHENHRILERKFKAYKETDYEALIHVLHSQEKSKN